jgi:hypothetical protein
MRVTWHKHVEQFLVESGLIVARSVRDEAICRVPFTAAGDAI